MLHQSAIQVFLFEQLVNCGEFHIHIVQRAELVIKAPANYVPGLLPRGMIYKGEYGHSVRQLTGITRTGIQTHQEYPDFSQKKSHYQEDLASVSGCFVNTSLTLFP